MSLSSIYEVAVEKVVESGIHKEARKADSFRVLTAIFIQDQTKSHPTKKAYNQWLPMFFFVPRYKDNTLRSPNNSQLLCLIYLLVVIINVMMLGPIKKEYEQ